jgi:hypothetical protein
MIAVLVDHNIERQGRVLWSQFSETQWRAMQVSSMVGLIDAGLAPEASDRVIWTFCQRQQMLLLTANRNRRGEDSLQSVIDELNDSASLPVLTISNVNRILIDSDYRELCAYRIADIALELGHYMGAARVFIP